ncbi:hypothetical protein AVEN_115176-1 [Araneus ventricosus]|uniref:Uncharacterized protein n=1 Tax=Araneus ventricosus TaxID=182803 RepID=A0A4Y1ZYD3_ARAVE|nr:hypothetical protein AVEN_115176-1 [Araneus ventricosus]
MTRTTPVLAPTLLTSAPHQREDVWPPTYDLACNRPNTRRIFSGIGFRTWSPLAPKSRPYHYATAATLRPGGQMLMTIFKISKILDLIGKQWFAISCGESWDIQS